MDATARAPARLPSGWAVVLVALFAAAMVALAIVGAVRHYSPVPYLDMWDGYVAFFLDIESGIHSQWWAMHNEHRVLLARALFWMDNHWFGSRGIFVLCVSYGLIGSACALFWAALRRQAPPGGGLATAIAGLLITAWLFQWMQEDNLTWPFQVQFFLAYVMPLAALLALARAAEAGSSPAWFAAACVLGFAAIGTMANGVLALPLLAACAIALRMGRARVAILVVLACAAWFLYFRNYTTPPHHGTATSGWRADPGETLKYLLIYLGSPASYLLGGGSTGRTMAQVAGAGFIAATAILAFKVLTRARERVLATALIFFLAYVIATAGATAGARLPFGLESARTSRYTTAALLAWVAIGVVWLSGRRGGAALPRPALGVIAIVCAAMLLQQWKALAPVREEFARREVAGLALAMGVRDEEMVRWIYPRIDTALSVAQRAAQRRLSIFGRSPYREAGEPLGRPDTSPSEPGCAAGIDAAVAVPGSTFRRVHGWMLQWPAPRSPSLMRIVDGNGRVSGYALSGGFQPSQTFTGYVQAGSTELALVRDDPPCRALLQLPKG